MVSMLVNPFADKDSGEQPDVVRKPVVELDELVEEAVRMYEGLTPANFFYENERIIRETQVPTLTSVQIELTLAKIISTTPVEKRNHTITGLYISKLVQQAYDKGEREFKLTTNDTNIGGLLCRFKPEELTTITIM